MVSLSVSGATPLDSLAPRITPRQNRFDLDLTKTHFAAPLVTRLTMASAALRDLITGYHELNPGTVEELAGEPSPLEFMRYVARNAPFVVRGCVRDWKAFRLWDKEFLAEEMRGMRVNVAVTPRG